MGPEEVKDYMIYGACAVAGAYTLIMVGGEILQHAGKRINCQEELDRVVTEESEKLGILRKDTGIPIIASYVDSGLGEARAWIQGIEISDEGEPILRPANQIGKENIRPLKGLDIGGFLSSTRGVVKHELYHLKYHLTPNKTSKLEKNAKSALGRTMDFLKYILIWEPEAILYATTGIELRDPFGLKSK